MRKLAEKLKVETGNFAKLQQLTVGSTRNQDKQIEFLDKVLVNC